MDFLPEKKSHNIVQKNQEKKNTTKPNKRQIKIRIEESK